MIKSQYPDHNLAATKTLVRDVKITGFHHLRMILSIMWFWEVRIRVCYQCSASNILKINPVILTLLESWNLTDHIMLSPEHKMVRWWDGEMVRWWDGEMVRWWDGEMVRFYILMRSCPVIWFNMCTLSSVDTGIIESQTYKIQRFRDSEIQRFRDLIITG